MTHINALIKNQHRGFSLVGIMIGLLLAMITVLASLTLYRTLAHTSVDSRIDAALDGQIASAMLTLQLEIQSAGFGYDTNVARVERSGNSIYWRYKDASVTPANICRGFRVQNIGAANNQLQLQLLKPNNCDDTTALLNSFGWNDPINIVSVLADIKVREGQTLPLINLDLVDAPCFPYGMGTINIYPQLTITIDNAARRAALDDTTLAEPNAPFIYSFCLSNIGGV